MDGFDGVQRMTDALVAFLSIGSGVAFAIAGVALFTLWVDGRLDDDP